VLLRNLSIFFVFLLAITAKSQSFFDNFSKSTVLDSTLWEKSGVEIKKTINSPATNAVLFDGIKADKSPYDFTDVNKRVKTDSLVSRPISAGSLAPTSTLNLWFYWQGGGTGDKPDSSAGDSLVLLVRDKNLVWQSVWRNPGTFDASQFYPVRLQLNSDFFHDSLQIKFQNYGMSRSDSAISWLAHVELSPSNTLAFWYDFSQPSDYGKYFKTNTGIFVNNTLCKNQPSFNVASFDGLNDLGRPHGSTYQIGPADSLVSHSINIDSASTGINPQDSLYISFYWQITGFGERPDEIHGDSLTLKLLDKNNRWVKVWHAPVKDTTKTDKFYQTNILLDTNRFYHQNFRFKFENYARLSGAFDVFNVDYIVLDTIKSPNQQRQFQDGRLTFADVVISRQPSSLYTPYTAVPYHHLSALNFASNFNYTVNNLSRGLNSVSTGYQVLLTGQTTQQTSGMGAPFVLAPNAPFEITQAFDGSSLTLPAEPFDIVHKVYVDKSSSNTGGYNFEGNDTLTTEFHFKDYYAYDDGIYERTVLQQTVKSAHALRFTALTPDTISHLDICIPYDGFNIAGQPITIHIWADEGGKPGAELYKRTDEVKYSIGRNPFTRYTIKDLVVVRGVFYVGFYQTNGNNRAIRVGVDKNNDLNKLYCFIKGDGQTMWTQQDIVDGVMMMRPIFSRPQIETKRTETTGEDEVDFPLELYPNPNATGTVWLNTVYDRVDLLDFSGRVLQTAYYTNQLQVSGLQGMYLLRAYYKGKHKVKKLLLQPN
jgi:hypothetical protein